MPPQNHRYQPPPLQIHDSRRASRLKKSCQTRNSGSCRGGGIPGASEGRESRHQRDFFCRRRRPVGIRVIAAIEHFSGGRTSRPDVVSSIVEGCTCHFSPPFSLGLVGLQGSHLVGPPPRNRHIQEQIRHHGRAGIRPQSAALHHGGGVGLFAGEQEPARAREAGLGAREGGATRPDQPPRVPVRSPRGS